MQASIMQTLFIISWLWIALNADPATVSAFMGAIIAGSNIYNIGSGEVGITSAIENEICEELDYSGTYVLEHGTFKQSPRDIKTGYREGFRLEEEDGWGPDIDGVMGIIQYNIGSTGKAVNFYFRVYNSWVKSPQNNEFDVFFTDADADISGYITEQCRWVQYMYEKHRICVPAYAGSATITGASKQITRTQSEIGVEVEASFAGNETPELTVDVQAVDKTKTCPSRAAAPDLFLDELITPQRRSWSVKLQDTIHWKKYRNWVSLCLSGALIIAIVVMMIHNIAHFVCKQKSKIIKGSHIRQNK
eukprot:453540_1